MKNPLVDALRQAGNDSAPDEADDRLRESDGGNSSTIATSQALQSAELDLLETGRYEAAEELIVNALPATDVNSDTGTPLAEQERPHGTPALAVAVRSENSRHKDAIVNIGRTCPLLCVFALATSAGAYLVLNDLSVMDLNQNFSTFSSGAGSTGSLQSGDADAVSLPATGVSIFDKFSVGSASRLIATGQSLQRTADKVPTAPRPTATRVEAAQVNVPPSTHNRKTEVKDAAYASVVAAYEHYQRGDLEAAENDYDAALEIEPNHKDGLAGRAAVYLQTGRAGPALTAYERLLAVDPQNIAAAAAILAIRSADPEWEVESELKLLLQRFPDSHHLHNALGSVYVGLEKWPEAKHAFLTAHELAPEIADYSYNTAVSLDRMGQQSAAQFYYGLALEAANNDSGFDPSAILARRKQFEQRQRERL